MLNFGFYNNITCLRRLGNKNKIADRVIAEFPDKFDLLISFFYGTGALENRLIGKTKQIIANDFDNEVFNLYDVLMTQHEVLVEAVEMLPYSDSAWAHYKVHKPDDKVLKAAVFLMFSNWGYLGKPDNLHYMFSAKNKEITLKNIKANYKMLVNSGTQFMKCDFRDVLKNISLKNDKEKQNSFIYADPPYLGTNDKCYNTPKWTEKDLVDLFDVCCNSGIRFAISEFENETVVGNAEALGLNVIRIRERQSLKNRNVEVLITNYRNQLGLFD